MKVSVAGVAALDVLDDPVVGRVGVGVSEGRDVLVGLDLARADGDQQGVVSTRRPFSCGRACVGSTHSSASFVQSAPASCAIRRSGYRCGRPNANGSRGPPSGGRRARHQAPKLDVDGVAGEPSEVKKTLDCRDAAPTDNDTEISHCRTVRASAPLAIGRTRAVGWRTTEPVRGADPMCATRLWLRL